MEDAGHALIPTSETSLDQTLTASGEKLKDWKRRAMPEMIRYSFLMSLAHRPSVQNQTTARNCFTVRGNGFTEKIMEAEIDDHPGYLKTRANNLADQPEYTHAALEKIRSLLKLAMLDQER